ncbi:MAG: hypothetical protein HY820_09320 [Acidobacteria bacterium]|nr:hypothetical protein [Acidobacteriota bacterium]
MELQKFFVLTLSVAALLAVPSVSSLAINAGAPSTIYATASDGRLSKTIGGAGSWRLLSNIAGVSRFGLDPNDPLRGDLMVMDPTNPNTLYLSTFNEGATSLLKSANAGTTLVINPRNPKHQHGDKHATPVPIFSITHSSLLRSHSL